MHDFFKILVLIKTVDVAKISVIRVHIPEMSEKNNNKKLYICTKNYNRKPCIGAKNLLNYLKIGASYSIVAKDLADGTMKI